MSVPRNPGFETAGAAPGQAGQWAFSATSAGWRVADFSGGGVIPVSVESFDVGWSTSPYFTQVSGGTNALFDIGLTLSANTRESFRFWSNNQHFQWTVNIGLQGTFNGGADNSESFSTGYGADTYLTELGPGNLTPTFVESFDPPGVYVTDPSGGTAGTFDMNSMPSEDFEEVFADVRFIVDQSGTTLCTAVDDQGAVIAHNMGPSFPVTLRSEGTLPTGAHEGATYYVKSPTTTTFNLALTVSGPAVDLIDFGSGALFVHADERLYWTNGD
jgi:hypothetical protein